MSKAMRRLIPGKIVTSLVFLLVLSGLLVAVSACADLDTDTSAPVAEATDGAGTTTVPTSTTETSTVEESAAEEAAVSEESAASEEPAASGDDETTDSGTTPTWVFTTLPPPTAVIEGWTRYEEDNSLLRSAYSDGWTDDAWSGASAGHYKYAERDASVFVRFNGTLIGLVAVKNSACGRVLVQLDGGPLEYLDLNRHEATASSSRVWTSPLLPAGEHTLVFRWAGTYFPPSLATFDALDVIGELVPSVNPEASD